MASFMVNTAGNAYLNEFLLNSYKLFIITAQTESIVNQGMGQVNERVIYKAEPDQTQSTSNAKGSLQQVVSGANQKLLTIQTVWPFTIFPHTLAIDANKVDIIHTRFFFFVAENPEALPLG